MTWVVVPSLILAARMLSRDPLLLLSATRLAALIRERAVKSAEVVEAHIRHIERVNPTLNAMVADRFEAARAEARAVDALLDEGGAAGAPPFLGVPCSIKESFAVAGMPNSAGLVARADVRAEEDAVTVTRLRAAGFIPLGVTNVSELCMWMETNNRLYGRTNNPYDPARTAGGSSGGEAAVIGAGGAPVGLGSDIGGSIRMPAFFNGVFGHKPTGGLVPTTGQFPLPGERGLRFMTTGPIARRAEDLMPVLRILAGPDARDPGCAPLPLGDPASVDLGALTVLSVEHDGVRRVSADLVAAQRKAAEALAACGATVVEARIDLLARALDIWTAMVGTSGGVTFRALLGGGRPVSLPRELARWSVRRSTHTLPALGLALLEDVGGLLPARVERALELGKALRAELVSRIGEQGVMLYPSYPSPAPRHYAPLLPPFQWTYTAVLNVMEMPATQVPLGLNGEGLPLGVQVAAIHGNDHVTIAVAEHLERSFGGWVPPSLSWCRR
ncbi:amidase [Sorangium atrum]|uniref:Amidase n=1 Tax=Sorangium atrum TaxID=2995308 RepID=A0ABT5C6B4_9BACT|nr:amidase [Sorangium aterium]MDC0681961.1 amidase [Sorangium aterium]